MTRVLLIPAPFVKDGRMTAYVPYGLLSLQAVAAQRRSGVSILDLSPFRGRVFRNSDELAGAIADQIERKQHEVIGLSTMCSSFHHSLGVAVEVGSRDPGARIWMGGPQASARPELLLQAFPEIEAIFVGEGEETFGEVMGRDTSDGPRSWTGISGVLTRLHPFSRRAHIEDLDALPPIDLALDFLPSYAASEDESSGGVPLEAQRGCPGRCTFCSTRLYWGSRVRYKSDKRLIQEMRTLHGLTGNPLFCLLGDNFAASRQRLLAFSREVAKEAPELKWECCMTVDRLREEDFEVLWAGGCRKLFVGLESGCQNTLDRIQKGIDLRRSVRLVNHAIDRGFAIHVSLIVGFPWETGADVNKTMVLHRELLNAGAYSYLTTPCPLPGTVLEQDEAFEPGQGKSLTAYDQLPHGPRARQIIARAPGLFTHLGRFRTDELDRTSLAATVSAASMQSAYYDRRNRALGRYL
jgi:radical SAM superfamily enzyme YgiQ (UPF0313 family)